MIGLYVILGALTSMAVLYGIAWERLRRDRWKTLHWISLVLVGLAWLLEHMSTLGWLSLLAAMGLEGFLWYGRRQHEAADLLLEGMNDPAELDAIEREMGLRGPEYAEPVFEDEPGVEGEAGLGELAPDQATAEAVAAAHREDVLDQQPIGLFLRTLVLLKTDYRAAPQVLLASARRAGQRDAALAAIQPDDATAALEAGELRIELRTSRLPVEAARLEMAISQAERQQEALAIAEEHVCYFEITTLFHFDTPRDALVRCQHRIHSALSEFAPVLGVLWPSSARLIPARQLVSLQRLANAPDGSMLKTCTSLRTFPLEGANAGFVLTDTLGLFVFGLPDLQVISEGPPEAHVRHWLTDTAERFFERGCDLADQSEIALREEDIWRVKYRRSAFAPDREVVQIAPRREAPGTWGGSWEVHATSGPPTQDAPPEMGGGWGAAEGGG